MKPALSTTCPAFLDDHAMPHYFEDEPAPAPPIVRPINIRIPA
jgi:hypothetical protein